MKKFDKFIEEAASKRCPEGKYYCNTDKCCKKIPKGWHVTRAGYLVKDDEKNGSDNGNGSGNGNGGSNGHGGNGNGGGNGGNGGS